MKKNLMFFCLLFAVMTPLLSQQDAIFTQYLYNTLSVNPAYAGSRNVFSITGMHRSQWAGIDGAPNTQTLNFDTRLSERVGIGFSIVNDEIGNGTNQNTYFDGVISYTIPTSREGKLAFGLKAGGHLLNIDFTKLENYQNEPGIIGQSAIDKKFAPNFGAGAYYYTESFYLGLSVPNFLKTEHFEDSGNNSSFLASERMNIYLITGYIFDLRPNWKFKPALLAKAVKGAPLQIDASANFMFNDKFTLGAAYRWNAALSVMFGLQITDQFMIGLAYDKETSELGNTTFNDGSFEVILRYQLLTRFKRALAPRFF